MFALTLLSAAPAAATPTLTEPVQATDSVAERAATELGQFAAWLVQVQEIQSPVMAALGGMQEHWRAVSSGPPQTAGDRLRPVIAEIVALAERTDQQLAALETPEFTSLGLSADLHPAVIVGNARRLNGQIRVLAQEFGPVLDAMARNDPVAGQQATGRLMSSLQLVFQSQILVMRGSLAATPRDESTWEMVNIQLLYFRAGSRILDSWPDNGISGEDRGLAPDLNRLAAELEDAARAGAAKLDSEVAMFSDELAAAEAERDAPRASIFRRLTAALAIDREIFSLGEELARVLRGQATRHQTGRISSGDLQTMFNDLLPIRNRLNDIIVREHSAFADGG